MANIELHKVARTSDGQEITCLNIIARELRGNQMIFKNLAGEASEFNQRGDRVFSIKFEDPETIAAIREGGYNIVDKVYIDKETGDEVPYSALKVKINLEPKFDSQVPHIYIVKNDIMTQVWPGTTKEAVDSLQTARLRSFDVELDPSPWVYGKKKGVTAYVKNLVMFIDEVPTSEFMNNYAKYSQDVHDDDIPF